MKPVAPAPPLIIRRGEGGRFSRHRSMIRAHGFEEIETHKYDWADKIIRVEVTPKLLQTLDLQNGSFRVMLKDSTQSAISYGQVEFPGEALVSLGFVKKSGARQPQLVSTFSRWTRWAARKAIRWSFFVRVVADRKKPAARCVLLWGANFPKAVTPGSRDWFRKRGR